MYVHEKVFLRGALRHYFNMKPQPKVIVFCWMLIVLAEIKCQKWFALLESGGFGLEDEEGPG